MSKSSVFCVLCSVFCNLFVHYYTKSPPKIKLFLRKSPLHGVLNVHHEGHEEFKEEIKSSIENRKS
jgi:hypothetical protein